MLNAPDRPRKKKPTRTLPPGQKLIVLVAIAAACCVSTVWLRNAQQNMQAAASGSDAMEEPPPPVVRTPAFTPLPYPLTQPLTDVTAKINECAALPKLHAGVFVVEPDSGRFVDIDSHRAYSAASMIKLPVLVELLQAVDAGTVQMDQKVAIRPDLKGGGSGYLQYRPDNSKITLNECAQLMMTISDNTATNMIIDLLGGKDKCNADFAKLGLVNTRINNWLPDLTGTNTTSPYDLGLLLAKLDKGQLLSPSSHTWLFSTLEKNRIRTLLPMGIPAGTKIADKTGDIASLVGDAGVITARDGKRYIAVVAVERPWNDRRANALIREISKCVYGGVTGDVEGVKALEQAQATAAARPQRHSSRHRRRHRHG